MKILFICSNLIGDTILSSGVIKHFIDQNEDGQNDDFLDNQTGQELINGDGIPDADIFDESLLYPFNAMDDFSHIRFQLQYFF